MLSAARFLFIPKPLLVFLNGFAHKALDFDRLDSPGMLPGIPGILPCSKI